MTPPNDSPRRRQTDRLAEARARENVDAIIEVIAEYSNSTKSDLLEWIQKEMLSFKKRKKLADFAWQAAIWVAIASLLGMLGTAAAIVWQHLVNLN